MNVSQKLRDDCTPPTLRQRIADRLGMDGRYIVGRCIYALALWLAGFVVGLFAGRVGWLR